MTGTEADGGANDERRDATRAGDEDGAEGAKPEIAPVSDTRWEAVFWDVGGVILNVDSVKRAHYRFLEELVERNGLDTPMDEVVETWRTTIGGHFRERDGTEFRSARVAYGKAVAALVDHEIPEREWLPHFRAVSERTLETNPGAEAALSALAETDLHVGVLSDADEAELEAILGGLGLLGYFDSITTSEAVGRTKPDPAMFEAALEASGADPDRSIMIGDRYRHDMAGAAAFGMTTVSHGADDGEAVDYLLGDDEDLTAVIEIVRGERVPSEDRQG